MRKVVALMHVSLDGFTAGPNGEMEWIRIDEEVNAYVADLLGAVDTAMYGRVTYQMMEGYWPSVPATPSSTKQEIEHAHWVENIAKVVFSRSLEQVEWNNTRLVRGDIAQEVSRLKGLPGKNLMIFGSPRLVHEFTALDLIDEYQITVNPVVLGSGTPLFTGKAKPVTLKLLETRTFKSGVAALGYERDRV